MSNAANPLDCFPVGSAVRLAIAPPYLKTAEARPMLQPAHRLAIGTEGRVVGLHPGGVLAVRFANGAAYLLEPNYLEPLA